MHVRAGRAAAKPSAPLSEEDKKDIQNLDDVTKAWFYWRDLLLMQSKALVDEAELNGIGRCQPSW